VEAWLASRYVVRMRGEDDALPGDGNGTDRDPVVEAYKRDIDRTLLRENLRRTPEQRVRALMALQQLAAEARRAGRALRL
jgi:hypothetical protein